MSPTEDEGASAIESLIRRIESTADATTLPLVRELFAATLELHAVGLRRLLTVLGESGPGGPALVERLGADGQVAALLLLHGLHPMPLGQRVAQALSSRRERLLNLGGAAEVVSVADGAVHIRLRAAPGRLAALAMRQEIEQALLEQAPDARSIVIADDERAAPPASSPLVTLRLPDKRRET